MKRALSAIAICVTACGATPDATELRERDESLAKSKVVWAEQFGTTEFDAVGSVATYGGMVYVAGATTGELPGQMSGGSFDAVLRRYDTNGTVVWTRQFGGLEDDQALAVVADASGVYVAGGVTELGATQAFVRKYDHAGEILWTNTFGGAQTGAKGLAIDATGVYVVGQRDGAFSGHESQGALDAFVRKLELGTGQEIWTHQLGTAADDYAFAVFVDATSVYVAGETYGAFPDFDNAGSVDTFVRKLPLNGEPPLWTRQFGGVAGDTARAITGDASGVYVAGTADVAERGYVRKLSFAGSTLWTRTIVGDGPTAATGIAVDASGIIVSGTTFAALPGSTSLGSTDVYLRRFDRKGKEAWTLQTGTGDVDFAFGLAVDGGGIYVGGVTEGAFGDVANRGGLDAFVMKVVPTTTSSRPRP